MSKRYQLLKDGNYLAEADDIVDLVSPFFELIRDAWQSGFTVHDNAPNVKWCVWSAVYYGGRLELSPIEYSVSYSVC